MKRDIKSMRTCILMLMISSFSVLLSYFASFEGNALQRILAYLIGVLFWAFLIIGYVIFHKISVHRKEYEKTHPDLEYLKKRRLPGILTFFSDHASSAIDIIMIISFIITLAFMFIPSLDQSFAIVFAAILIFSIHMHCILNGVNFRYISHLTGTKGE